MGTRCDPEATSRLWRCDGGGSHAANPSLCNHDVQGLTDQLGVAMRVAHSPSECAPYHGIARRLLPPLTRAWQGRLFDTLDTVVTCRRKASTSTGLRTTVNVRRRHDATGRKATAQMQHNLRIVCDNLLPKWHDRAIPQDATVIH
jgi:Rhodopirellula transposase DDE domain